MGGMGGMRMGGMGAMRPKRYDVIPNKTHVVVKGLHTAPQHNGKSARIVEFDAHAGRYNVQLEDGVVVALKPTNMTQCATVHVVALNTAPHLNGQQGTITHFDDNSGRYNVQVAGKLVALQPANVVLPQGTCARVVGLTSTGGSQYNGKWGQIMDVDLGASRYNMQLDAEKQLKVKFENVRV
eukprot:TRINITY_DN757_c0_g1_i2.p1 TRINITY_DN757_c0_g1~~TRINITY_DN757_c0_g1_i2.p1  ORF type:complete len:201 (-),score=66.48 TRINITY_DN757_c0_g1_i2:247-792(-)